MSFSATLYNCSDDPRKAVKTLPAGIPVATITPTESCDILNPTFILNYNASYATCNYIFVGAPFNRRYFITDIKIDIGKKIVITCAVDVLSTYWADIKGNEVNVVRQENLKEPYLPDPEYKTYTDFAPFVIMPSNEDIANLVVGDLNPEPPNTAPKIYIVSYVGGPRGGN